MLNKQLQDQIEQEAIDGTKVRAESEGDIGWNQGYERGYEAAGEKYAEKWQEAQQLVERYEKALKEIQAKAQRGIFPHLPVEIMGAQMCIEIDQYVTDLLTPKTGSDD